MSFAFLTKKLLLSIIIFLVGVALTSAACNYTNINDATIQPGNPQQIICTASEDIAVASQICEVKVPGSAIVTLTDYAGTPITNYVEIETTDDENATDITFFIKASVDDLTDTTTKSLTGALSCGGSPSDMIILTIDVVNDHTPQFSASHYSLTALSESFPPSIDLMQTYGVEITSYDGDTNGDSSSIMDFTIISGDDLRTFQIGKYEDSCNSTYCAVTLMVEGKLDFLKFPSYDLTIQVQDQGTPPLSSTTVFHINIQDSDNLNPQFQSTFYYSTADKINAGSYELTMTPSPIEAIDQDTRINSPVEYSLVIDSCGPSCDAIVEAFTIDPTTGVITFDSDVDLSSISNSVVTFGVQAIQTDNAYRLTMAIVSVTLPNNLSSTTSVPTINTVTETKSTYSDPQTTNAIPCTCTSTPNIVTTGLPASISSAATSPSSPLTTCPPCPTLNPCATENVGQIIFVSDLTPLNTTVVQITDVSPDSEKHFQLSGGDAFFDIDQHGNIFTKTYLQTDDFALTISITSTNNPNLKDDAQINITVVSEQHSSALPANIYRISIDEEMEGTTLLVDLISLYENTGVANYSIITASQSSEKFSIDEATGKLYAISAFDCEAGETSIEVMVRVDRTVQEITQTEEDLLLAYNQFLINVIINDVNDNPPLFYGDNVVNGQLTLAISSYTSSGQQIIQLQTNDPDVDAQNRITYYKTEANDNFYIDQNTGLLLASKSLSSLDNANYSVLAKATNDLSGTSEDCLSITIYMLQEQSILTITYGYSVEYFENNHVKILNDLSSSLNSGVNADKIVQIGGLKWIAASESSLNSTKAYLYGFQSGNVMGHSDLKALITNNAEVFSSNNFETDSAQTYDQTPEAQPDYIPVDETSYIVGISLLTVFLGITLIAGVAYAWYIYKKERKLFKLYHGKAKK